MDSEPIMLVSLELVDHEAWVARLPARLRSLAAGSRAMGFSEINLNISNLDVAPEQIWLLILERLGQSRPSI